MQRELAKTVPDIRHKQRHGILQGLLLFSDLNQALVAFSQGDGLVRSNIGKALHDVGGRPCDLQFFDPLRCAKADVLAERVAAKA
jgi:hypothetical protein